MKLKIALATTLLAFGATTAQAADTRTPDILSTVSSDSVQAMTNNEAGQVRGEYWTCYHPNNGSSSNCHYQYTRSPLPHTEQHPYGYTTNSYVVSFDFIGGPIYVAR